MKHLFTIFISLVCVSAFNCQVENSLLWSIKGKGLKKTSYLYGTFHVQDERVFFRIDEINEKLDDCKFMAGELNHQEEMADPMALLGQIQMKDSTLTDFYSAEEYEYVKAQLEKKLGMMAFMADKLKPFYTMTMLMEDNGTNLQKDSLQESPNFSEILDDKIQSSARSKGLEVFGLETAEDALLAIDQISLKKQANLLIETLKEMEANPQDDQMEKMVEIYINEDLNAMLGMYNKLSMGSAFEQHLIVHRNSNFVDELIKLMKEKPTFCAVGALHLPGERGMIKMLQEMGYSVEPVYSEK